MFTQHNCNMLHQHALKIEIGSKKNSPVAAVSTAQLGDIAGICYRSRYAGAEGNSEMSHCQPLVAKYFKSQLFSI